MAFRDHHPPFVGTEGDPLENDPVGIYSSEPFFVDTDTGNINITLKDPQPIISGSLVYDGRYGIKVGSVCVVFVSTSSVLENNHL